MYKALDVARYIINNYHERDIGISNLKLQKVLYFVQAEFLVNSLGVRPCFGDRIEAWDFGPVVPNVYRQYRVYGSTNIPIEQNDPFANCYATILHEDTVLINEMITKTLHYSAAQLVAITHNQAPWKNAYRPGINKEITCESIYNYFKE